MSFVLATSKSPPVASSLNPGSALQCKSLLPDHAIDDVDVEIRESELVHSGSPKLLNPGLDSDATAGARKPFAFAPTLGITICSQSTPCAEGTTGFFLNEGGDGKRRFLVTARHVVSPQQRRQQPLLF